MSKHRMYHELAHFWPLLSPVTDYELEASFWRQVLLDRIGDTAREILELGVGGGHNLSYLTRDFKATAVDLSAEMLACSRSLNPTVDHIVGDMRTVRLDRRFDAVLVHDAINYMVDESDVMQALATAHTHLRPGGVFLAAPDFVAETFEPGAVRHASTADECIELTRIEYQYDPDPDDTTVETLMFFLIRQGGGPVQVEQDRHVTGLFAIADWLRFLRSAGFTAEALDYPANPEETAGHLFVGTKP